MRANLGCEDTVHLSDGSVAVGDPFYCVTHGWTQVMHVEVKGPTPTVPPASGPPTLPETLNVTAAEIEVWRERIQEWLHKRER